MSPVAKQTPVRFTPQIRARLDEEVRRTGLSISVLVNIALDRYLPALPGDAPPAVPPPPSAPASDEGVADFE